MVKRFVSFERTEEAKHVRSDEERFVWAFFHFMARGALDSESKVAKEWEKYKTDRGWEGLEVWRNGKGEWEARR
jgi:hypothetical protein